jgi:hypothetical protein
MSFAETSSPPSSPEPLEISDLSLKSASQSSFPSNHITNGGQISPRKASAGQSSELIVQSSSPPPTSLWAVALAVVNFDLEYGQSMYIYFLK